ncbi:MAG TPA: gamma-glutamyltransferase [Magnetospirillaceae bacterium]|nr:gamma-glutamyltransferase [Magnetospirillaceae bacterium]
MRRVGASLFILGLVAAGAAKAASRPAVEGEHAMIVSEEHYATQAGLQVLREGGNAVDAAVAVGYALAVTHPCCGNIGGGGFMLIHMADGTEKFVDFRETAPAAATPDMYLDSAGNPVREASIRGWKASAVPGTVAGFELAEQSFGKLGRAKVMAPAVKLAHDGYSLSRGDTDILDYVKGRLAADPVAAKIFLKADGSSYKPGETLRQEDLAKTLERIAKQGGDAFYKGPVAEAVAKASAAGGGLISTADLAGYKAEMLEPLHCSYRGTLVSTAPPPSSGGIGVCEMLNVLSGFDLAGAGFHSALAVHEITEAMRSTFRDRNTLLGDPNFIANPTDKLLSDPYAAEVRSRITDKATASDQLPEGSLAREKQETTHFSVVDAQGNAVAVTFTLNGFMGSGVMAPGTGFFLNNEMDDFTVKPGTANMFGLQQGARNMIAPNKRPLSSMAPTIVSKDGKVFLVLGSPGGSRISTHILQAIVNVVDYGMKPQEAVDAPRFHHQFQPDKLYAEPFAFSADTAKMLKDMGYNLADQPTSGAVGLIERAPDAAGNGPGGFVSDMTMGKMQPGWLYGASDSRRPAGSAEGY